jgi:7-cyano-7-deazaguanine synthase
VTRSVVLFSGGMDSTVLLTQAVHAEEKPIAVSFDYGQRHGQRELAAAAEIAAHLDAEHRIIDLSALARHLPG